MADPKCQNLANAGGCERCPNVVVEQMTGGDDSSVWGKEVIETGARCSLTGDRLEFGRNLSRPQGHGRDHKYVTETH